MTSRFHSSLGHLEPLIMILHTCVNVYLSFKPWSRSWNRRFLALVDNFQTSQLKGRSRKWKQMQQHCCRYSVCLVVCFRVMGLTSKSGWWNHTEPVKLILSQHIQDSLQVSQVCNQSRLKVVEAHRFKILCSYFKVNVKSF